MDILEVIRARRTVGKSTGELPRETIYELIEAATWAPNHKLTQPWRFTVVNGAARERLGQLWAERAAASIEESARAAFIEGEAAKPLRAPTVIVVSTCTSSDPVRAEEDLTATAAAVQNMLLAAEAKGLSAAWKTGKIIYDAAVKTFLGLQRDDRIVAMVYVGAVAGETVAPRDRNVAGCVNWLDESGVPA